MLGTTGAERSTNQTTCHAIAVTCQRPVFSGALGSIPPSSSPDTLVFVGPGGGNDVQTGTRTVLSSDNLRRIYHAALAKLADPAAVDLRPTARRVLAALRADGPQPPRNQPTVSPARAANSSSQPSRPPCASWRAPGRSPRMVERMLAGRPNRHRATTCSKTWSCMARTTSGTLLDLARGGRGARSEARRRPSFDASYMGQYPI